jgi:hypothetical protein
MKPREVRAQEFFSRGLMPRITEGNALLLKVKATGIKLGSPANN